METDDNTVPEPTEQHQEDLDNSGTNTPENQDTPPDSPVTDEIEDTTKDTKEDEVTEADPTEPVEPTDGEWMAYNDKAIDGVQSILQEEGVTADEADVFLQSVLETGNIDPEQEKALIERLGESKAALVIAGTKDFYDRALEKVNATTELVHNEFGGEDNFNVVSKWAQETEKTNPEFADKLNTIRHMFDIGGFAAEAAAKELNVMYNNDPGTSTPNPELLAGDTTNAQAVESITRSDYLSAVKKARDKGDHNEVRRLEAQRHATIVKDRADAKAKANR